MEGKSIYTILLAIIAVLTLSLAVLIIFLFVSYNPNRQAAGVQGNEAISERVVPDDEMIEFSLFEGEEKMFALKSEAEHPDSIVLVSVSMKCDAGPKKRKESEITNIVTELYKSELEQAVGDYFADMTLTEAKQLETRYKARDDLMNIFNETLNINKMPKEKVIYQVILQMFPQ